MKKGLKMAEDLSTVHRALPRGPAPHGTMAGAPLKNMGGKNRARNANI